MTRSLEILVQAHTDADARRRRGLHPWAYSVPVAALLQSAPNELTAEVIAKLCADLAALLKTHLPGAWLDASDRRYDRDFDELVDRLEGVTDQGLVNDRDCQPVEFFDAALEELYDWADLHRVSCGLPGQRPALAPPV